MLVSRRLGRTLAGALTATVLATPTAVARPALEPGGYPSTGSSNAIERQPDSTPQIVTRTIDPGFDWDSAAVGAGGTAVVLLVIGAGSSLLHRPRRAGALH